MEGGSFPKVIADQNMIEHLGVAVVDVAVLLSCRQSRDQIGQHTALEDCQRRGELKVVEVAERHDIGVGVESQDGVYEVVDDLRLLVALDLGDQHRRLGKAKQRVVAALRVEVIGDQEQGVPDFRLAQCCIRW